MNDKPYPSPEELDAEVARAMADHFIDNLARNSLSSREAIERMMLGLFRCAMTSMPAIIAKYGPPPRTNGNFTPPIDPNFNPKTPPPHPRKH